MNAKLHQMKASFVPAEDRILLAIRRDDNTEYRVWVTRRMLRLLLPALVDSIKTAQSTDLGPEHADVALQFNHEQALSETDFATPYEDSKAELPLGDQGLLAVSARVQRVKGKTYRLSLQPASGAGLTITLDSRLIHALMRILEEAAVKAEWDMTRMLVQAGSDPASQAGSAGKQLRH